MYSISSALSKKTVEEKKPVIQVEETESAGVPSVDSPAFDTFIESGALDKLLENDDQLLKVTESM